MLLSPARVGLSHVTQRSFTSFGMTPVFASTHRAKRSNSVIPNEVRDLSLSLDTGGET